MQGVGGSSPLLPTRKPCYLVVAGLLFFTGTRTVLIIFQACSVFQSVLLLCPGTGDSTYRACLILLRRFQEHPYEAKKLLPGIFDVTAGEGKE
jgi:hypothetical protein